jgi:Na+/melibiose symporter-like transporter
MKATLIPSTIIMSLLAGDYFNDDRFVTLAYVFMVIYFVLCLVIFTTWIVCDIKSNIHELDIDRTKLKMEFETNNKFSNIACFLLFATFIFYGMYIMAALVVFVHYMVFWMVDDVKIYLNEEVKTWQQ